jgi:hypothetical protein
LHCLQHHWPKKPCHLLLAALDHSSIPHCPALLLLRELLHCRHCRRCQLLQWMQLAALLQEQQLQVSHHLCLQQQMNLLTLGVACAGGSAQVAVHVKLQAGR